MTQKEPFFKRLLQYSKERFPLAAYLVLILCYFGGGVALGTTISSARPEWYNCLLGFIITFLFFFHLRIFDEFKDFEEDKIGRPERPVPRGLISLKELGVCLIFVLGAELLFSYIISLSVGFWFFINFCIMVLYSVLMLKEFFLKDKLKQNIMVYAYSHEFLFLFFTFFLFGISGNSAGSMFNLTTIFYTLFSIMSFLIFEITRKVRLPEEEREHIETYSQAMGLTKASKVALLHLFLATLFFIISGIIVGFHFSVFILILLVSLFPFYYIFLLLKKPSPGLPKKAENGSAIYMLISHLLLIIYSIV